MQKILIILAAALSLAAAVLGYLNRSNIALSKSALTTATSEIAAANKKAASMSAELKAKTEKLALVNSDQEKVASENADLMAQVAKSTSAMADVQKQVADRDASLAQMKSDMAAKDAHIADLDSKISSTVKTPSAPSDDLKKQLEEKDMLTTSLQAKIKDQETQLAALKERESQRRSKSMRSGLEGSILAVNTSWNFVVLSLGDRNGVVNNAEMLIKRGSQLIGKVRITSVEPSTSIADIVVNSVSTGLSVQPGDTVIYSGPGNDSSDNKSNL
jgi:septal ring factor EnvC (AmiA/AmiB activator)